MLYIMRPLLAIALGLALLFAVSAQAERRVALVIGNGQYRNVSPLKNPRNDAVLMRDSLRRAGFKVTMVRDAGILKMRKAIIDFGNALNAGAVGLFYYSGHGIQLGGANFMVPVDAELRRRDYASIEAVNLNEVLTRMGAAEIRLNIVILDACRNNPFPSFKKAASRGLAVTQAPGGTYIAYATGPGSVADDGDGRNSPFTTALASTIGEPGLHLDGVFNKVRAQVMAATKNAQTPWSSSSVTGDFYFHLPTQPDPNRQAAATWELIKDSRDPAVIEKFILTYPSSPIAPVAKNRLAALQKSKFAALTPSPKPEIDLVPVEAAYVTTRNANVRAKPSINAAKVTTLPTGTEVYVLDRTEDGNWLKVEKDGKAVGYIYKTLLEDKAAREEARHKLAAATPPEKPPGAAKPKPAVGLRFAPGDTFKDCAECPEMVVIPPGSFMMGSPTSEADRDDDEGPQHRITLPQAFAVGRFEITFAQWYACVSGGGCGSYRPAYEVWDKGTRPVVSVSSNDAQTYVKWLSRNTSQPYRLLTEAQWEYAARAGATTSYTWGSYLPICHPNVPNGARFEAMSLSLLKFVGQASLVDDAMLPS